MQLTHEDGRIVLPADINQVLFDMTNSPVVQAPDWSPFAPYDWQQAIWMALWGAGRMVAVRTCNEAQPASSKVLMGDKSWERIDNLKLGMFVSSPQGERREILGLSEWRQSAVFEVEMEDGGKCSCTDDHLWTVRFERFSDKKVRSSFVETLKLASLSDFLKTTDVSAFTPEYGKGLERRIKSITHIGFDLCRCIKIDHPDGLYVTDDYIVTHNSGKTSCVVPIAALAWAAAFPGSQVVVTSASERQFDKQLMPTFGNMIAKRKGWRKTSNTIYAPSQDGLPPSEIVCFATKSGDLFEGFHNRTYFDDNGVERFCPLLIIADEAKSIKQSIFTAIERCNPTAELRISTCGEDTGGHYEACTDETGLWTRGYEWNGRHIDFKVPWTDCPHLLEGHTLERKMAMLQKKGPNDPVVRSILLAEFFRSGDHMVFDDSDLMAIQDCQSGLIPYFPGQRRAFCDLSGGGDELTFGLREGNRINPIIAWTVDSHTPPSEKAARYIRLFKTHNLRDTDIFCDNGGLGSEIINEMNKRGWNVNRVNFGKGAIDKERFTTRIAELHWEFKHLCHEKAIILPSDDKFYEQARKRRYTMKNDDSGCINLEDKKKARRERQEHSPDRLETVIGLLIGHEQFVSTSGVAGSRQSICGTIHDYWKHVENGGSGRDEIFGGGWGGAS